MGRHGSWKNHAFSACRCVTTILVADSRLLVCRIAPRESKKHEINAWFFALMSTHWAIRGVILQFFQFNYCQMFIPFYRAIQWVTIAKIVASWVISPLLSGVMAITLYKVVSVLILKADSPFPALLSFSQFSTLSSSPSTPSAFCIQWTKVSLRVIFWYLL